MEKELLEIFKKQLIDKREEIFNEAGKTLSDMTDQNINIPDPNDRATVESGRSFELRIRDRERKLLSKIEAALERFESLGKLGRERELRKFFNTFLPEARVGEG